jgi:hypothetical protein
VWTRGFALLFSGFPMLILERYSPRPDLRQVRFIDSIPYVPGLKLGFPALATSF